MGTEAEMVDVSEAARNAGLTVRTILSPAAWELFTDRGNLQARDIQKRISLVFNSLQMALTRRRGPKPTVIYFSAYLWGKGNMAHKLGLKAAIENHASGQLLVVMLPDEGPRENVQGGEDQR
jgi:hypothetical protein